MPQTHTSDDRSQRTDDTVQTTDDSFQTTDIRQQPPDDSVYFKFFLGSSTTEKNKKSSTPPDREMELEQDPFVSVIEYPAHRRSGKPCNDFLVLYPYHFEMSRICGPNACLCPWPAGFED